MKKMRISMSLILLSTQFLFPMNSFAEELDKKTTVESTSTSNTQNDNTIAANTSTSDTQKDSTITESTSTSESQSTTVTTPTPTAVQNENKDITSFNLTVSADVSYLNGATLRSNQPLVLSVTVNKPANTDISNDTITFSGFNSSYIDLSKAKLSNGLLADNYGQLSYDATTGKVVYTFNNNLNSENEGKFVINIYIYGQDLSSDSPTQTITGVYRDHSLEETPVDITNPEYIVSKKATSGSSTDNRVQAPGGGLYDNASGQLFDNYAGTGNTISNGQTITGRAYYPATNYMATNNVIAPANIGAQDLGRKFIYTVSGSAEIDINKIYITKGKEKFFLTDDYFKNFGTFSLSDDKKTLTVNFIDNVNISWFIFNMETYTPNIDEIYTFTWTYQPDQMNSTGEEVTNHSSKNFFIKNGTSGFIPRITTTDKSINVNDTLSETETAIKNWLLTGITATDVEDGNLTNSLLVKDDGGFSSAWKNKTSGKYTITYSVTDSDGNVVTATSTVTIYSDIIVHYQTNTGIKLKEDSTLSGNAGDTYSIATSDITVGTKKYYFVSANPDTLTGQYGATGQPKEVTLTYAENKQSLSGSDYTMYVGDKNATLADFKASATDKDGNAIDVTTDLSTIDFSKAGSYSIVLKAADGQTKTVTLTIKENKQSLSGSDYTMYVGDKEATLANFKASATDRDGNAIDVTADLSAIDFSKAGSYSIDLKAADGQTKTVTLIIKENKQSFSGSDYTMYVGDKEATLADFKASATDRDGNAIDVTADLSAIDFSKAGSCSIDLKAADGQTKTVTLTIKENKQSLSGSDYTMYIGDKEATLADFKASATDKDGNAIDVTTDLSTIDFSKIGSYSIVLKAADGQTKTVTLIIKENKQSLSGSDYTMYVGDKDPVTADFKATATGKDGNAIDVTADLSAVDFSKAGSYSIVLKAADGQTKTVTLTIKEKKVSDPTDSSSTGKATGTAPTTTHKSLPNTGEQNSTVFYILGSSLLAAAVMLYRWMRRKNPSNS